MRARTKIGVVSVAVALAVSGCATAPQATPAASPAPDPVLPAPSSVVEAPSGPPAVGTPLLAALPADGRVNVIGNAKSGFSVLQSITTLGAAPTAPGADRSTLTTYDAAGHPLASLPAGSLSGECGAADVTPDRRRLVVTALVTTQPAQGVAPAQYAESLVGWDAGTGEQVWKTEIVPAQERDLLGDCSSFYGQLLGQTVGSPRAGITSDGRFGVLHVGYGRNSEMDGVVDLASGRLVGRTDALGTLGDYVVTGTDPASVSGGTQKVTLTEPPAFGPLGSFQLTSSNGEPGVPASFPEGSSSGVFDVVSAGSSPGSGVSDDGRTLFTYEFLGDRMPYSVRARRLPDMTVLWTQTPPADTDLQLVAEGGGVLVGRSIARTTGTTTMVGLDAATGVRKWSLPTFDVCGITRTQLLASANNQLAVIDLGTGKQLSFTGDSADGSTGCPTVLPSGIAFRGGSGPVTQVLTP